MAVGALAMAFAGGVSLLLQQSGLASSASDVLVIEVNEQGFNPPVCQVGRSDEVAWKNVGHEVHRIIKPNAGVGLPPIYDSGDLQPGDTSGPLIPGAGGQFKYQDAYNPDHKGVIETPQRSNDGPIVCSPLAPTPTPTPTPIPTATPVVPANCRATALGAPNGFGRCPVVPGIAADSAGE